MDCLVIKNDGIGDLVLSSGVIASLATVFKGTLDLVTCEQNRGIAELIPGLRNVYYVSRDNLNFVSYKLPFTCRKDKAVLREISRKQYDTAICLRRFIRQSSLVIMHSVSARKKYCCWQMPTNLPRHLAEKYSKGWFHYNGNMQVLSELEYFWNFCSSFLKDFTPSMPVLKIDSNSEKAFFEGNKVALGISGTIGKIPIGIWVKVAELLSKRGWSVHLVGDKRESEYADFIKKIVPSVTSHVGKLSLSETLQLLSRFRYYIGNDTGISHIASLVVPKVLMLLGGGTFLRFFPWPNREGQHVFFYGLDCFDCNWRCKYSKCYCLELLSAPLIFKYFIKISNGENVPKIINIGDPTNFSYELAWRICGKESIYSFQGMLLGNVLRAVGNSFIGSPLLYLLWKFQRRMFPELEEKITLEETMTRLRQRRLRGK